MKTKVDGITVSIGKSPKPSVYIHRGLCCNLYCVTPSSLRRAQRAQLALVGGGRVNSSAVNAEILAALENLVAKYNAMQNGNISAQLTNGDFFNARAVIAKAKGESAE